MYSCNTGGLQEVLVESDYNKEVYYIDKDSLRQGEYVELSKDGKDTISTVHFKDDKMDGRRKIYDSRGNVATIETYSNGIFHGPEITFFPSGQMHTKGNFTNGKLDSLFYVYYETGELKEKVTMRESTENGPFEEYYKNGKVHWQGTFIDGPNEIGLLKEFSEEGELIKKMECGKYSGDYICQTIWEKGNGDVKLQLEYEE